MEQATIAGQTAGIITEILKNGYVRETYQSVAEREKRAAAQQDRSPDIYDSMFDAVANNLGEVKLRPQDIIISTILSFALIAFFAITFAIYFVFMAPCSAGPITFVQLSEMLREVPLISP